MGWLPAGHADDDRAVGDRWPRDLRRAEEARRRPSRSRRRPRRRDGDAAGHDHHRDRRHGWRPGRGRRTAPAPTSTSSSCPRPTARASTTRPSLVYCHRDETTREAPSVDGDADPRASRASTRSPTYRSLRLARHHVGRAAQRAARRDRRPRARRVDHPLRPPALRRPVADRRGLTWWSTTCATRSRWSPGAPAGSGGPWASASSTRACTSCSATSRQPVLEATVAELREGGGST